MSVRLMADVWDNGPKDASEAYVLLVLANCANDAGENCFPSVEFIADKARRSVRQVQRVLLALEDAGWIVIERGRGSGKFSRYRIVLESLKRCHGVTFKAGEKKVTSATGKGDICDKKGDICDLPIRRTVREPSENQNHHPQPPPAGATGSEKAGSDEGTTKTGAAGVACIDEWQRAEDEPSRAFSDGARNVFRPPDAQGRETSASGVVGDQVERCMEACGFVELRGKTPGRLRRVLALVIARGDDPATQTDRMIEAWQEVRKNAHLLKWAPSPRKFYEFGTWSNADLWPWDEAKVERMRNARVGSW